MKPFITYNLLAIAISWLVWLPLYGYRFGLVLPAINFQHELGAYGPLVSALVTTRVFQRKSFKEFIAGMFTVRNWLYIIIGIAGPFIIGYIALFINGTFFTEAGALFKSKAFPSWSFATIFLYNVLTFGMGEEIGWRGFALPFLQKRFGPVITIIVLTTFWGIWHIPLFLYRPGYMSMDLAAIIGWFASLFTGSILLAWLYNGSKGGVIACIFFHACMDIVFMAAYNNDSTTNILGVLVTIWGIVIAIIFGLRLFQKNHSVFTKISN